MKGIIAIMTAVIMILTMAACGAGDKDTPPAGTTDVPGDEATTETVNNTIEEGIENVRFSIPSSWVMESSKEENNLKYKFGAEGDSSLFVTAISTDGNNSESFLARVVDSMKSKVTDVKDFSIRTYRNPQGVEGVFFSWGNLIAGESALYFGCSFINNKVGYVFWTLMRKTDYDQFNKDIGKVFDSVSIISGSPEPLILDGTEETPTEKEQTPSGPTFADGVYTEEDYTIKITDSRVIQPGDTGNEYGKVPVIAFWYEVTNISRDSLSSDTAWIGTINAIQDNDPNVVNELNVAMSPDKQFLDSGREKIKIGGTVADAIAYELDDETTPVTLIAQNISGDEYGRQDFPVK